MRVAALALLVVLPLAAAQTPSLAPEQPHVTLAPDGLVVHFAYTDGPQLPVATPQIVYRIDGGAEQSAVPARVGNVVSLVPTDGFATAVWAATIPVGPGETLSYRIVDPVRGDTPTYDVRRPTGDWRLVVIGDIGYDGVAPDGTGTPLGSAPIAVRDLALQQDPDLALLAGDLSYLNTRAGWDRFMRMQTPLQATVPTIPAIGNHEWEDGPGYGQYLAQYVLPGDEENYVVHTEHATIVVVNSDAACIGVRGRSGGPIYRPCPDGVDQERKQWLEGALRDAAADAAPWTLVLMHHPPYSWGNHGSDWVTHVYWAPLFERHRVDLVLTAHDHVYARTHPVIQREVQATTSPYRQGLGPIYAVSGGGGRELYDLPADAAPDWLAGSERTHHLALLDVNATAIAYQALRLDGSVLDSFVLERHDGPARGPVDSPAPGVLLALAGLAIVVLRRRG